MKKENERKVLSKIPKLPIIIGVVFNIVLALVGFKTDLFPLLIGPSEAEYSLNVGNLQVIITLSVVGTLLIYHSLIGYELNDLYEKIESKTAMIDSALHGVKSGLKRVEVHLLNYDNTSIEFEHLSAIESEIGAGDAKIHNEIWIITNNFEEKEDSAEGKELRTAILSNLKTSVDYYYVIPSSCLGDIELLGYHLSKEVGNGKTKGHFFYCIDDNLDILPTPYYDIIMYLKMTADSGNGEAQVQTSSQIYYCFSRSTEAEDCLYLKVDRSKDEFKATWNNMMQWRKKYKERRQKEFKNLI